MGWVSRPGITIILACIAFVSWSRVCFATSTPAPTVDAKIVAAAKEWFHRFQIGDIDRSQLNAEVNQQVTAEGVRKEKATLKAFGKPISFRFIGSAPIKGAIGYYFDIEFSVGRVVEAIAYDADGKIAGIDFQTYVPDSPDSTI